MSSPLLHYSSVLPSTGDCNPARLRASSYLSTRAPIPRSRTSTSHPSSHTSTSHPSPRTSTATRFRVESDHSPMPCSASHSPSATSSMMGDNPVETLSNGAIRCWSHGCNGREFSSLGNYRRHFREQHRVCKKFNCQRCGRTFSRSTARNVHFEKRKCRAVQLDENGVPVTKVLHDSDTETYSPTASHFDLSPPMTRDASVDSSFSYQPLTPPEELLHMSPMSSFLEFDGKSLQQSPLPDFDSSAWGMWDDGFGLGEPAMLWDDWNSPLPSPPMLESSYDCMALAMDLPWVPQPLH